MPTVIVDGRELELDANDNLLEALLGAGEDLPYFCWHPEMGSVGACRQCAVVQYQNAEDTRGRIVMACMTPVTDGAIFSLGGDRASGFRQSVVENLMLNHPHDCPVCEEGGECHLQDMTVMTGHRDRKTRHKKRTYRNQYLGPFIGHEMNRCITCYRCVRYYQDYAGGDDLSAFASRNRVYFGRSEDGMLENEFAGNLVEVCPTGVFTDKTLSKRYSRKWDLQSSPAVCTACSMGCNIFVSERYGEFRRVHNRYHSEVNGYFLCDRGRFGHDYVDAPQRLRRCGVRSDSGKYQPVDAQVAVARIAAHLKDGARVVGIGSPRASIESNFALRELVGAEHFYNGCDPTDAAINAMHVAALRSNLKMPGMRQIEHCDAVLVLGEDVTQHAPRLALALRQAVRERARGMAEDARIPQWNDAAVRKLAQDARCPMFVVTPGPDRLDDVGVAARLHPTDIAALGQLIAGEVDASFATDHQLDSEQAALATTIASTLRAAKRPLIVAGSSLRDATVVAAAINIATALTRDNTETSLVLCGSEANSVGVTLLSEQALPNSAADVAIVVENDLTRRFPSDELARWLGTVGELIVIDSMETETAGQAAVVLPAATNPECGGTWINHEGRAQHSFGAFPPADCAPSWRWLQRIAAVAGNTVLAGIADGDHLLERCATEIDELKAVVDTIAQEEALRGRGVRIARQTHRYSGRTAMRANISVHEPQQPVDTDSALAYSMEGVGSEAPASLRTYVWSPGWNSNQAINKFQQEIGGAQRGGDPGVRLFRGQGEAMAPLPVSVTGRTDGLAIIPAVRIFGTDELTAYSPALQQAIAPDVALMNADIAASLGVTAEDGVECADGDSVRQFAVRIDDRVADHCVLLSATACNAGLFTERIELRKADNWVPPVDTVIASDRAAGGAP